MTELSNQNRTQSLKLSDIATRHGVSLDAVMAIYDGLRRSNGSMAQFSHPELGGMGQWSSGMLMIGEFSNSVLKEKVQAICAELSELVAGSSSREMTKESAETRKPMEALRTVEPIQPIKPMEPMESLTPMEPLKPMQPMKPLKPFDNIQWWPSSLGTPSSAGSQNQIRYAYFPATNRLAIEQNGKVTTFDTGRHKIHGASQAQGESTTLAFDSQLGRVTLSDLTEVSTPSS
ncbi:MAG: hypothetical protein JST89_16635 [Cyanobacteria bacterium SZAS-4]|nr:hypothetical protein [Cyanobacteria bacterium SZAS-4]